MLHQIQCKFIPKSTKKIHFLHHCRKLLQIRYHKDADGIKCTNILLNRFFTFLLVGVSLKRLNNICSIFNVEKRVLTLSNFSFELNSNIFGNYLEDSNLNLHHTKLRLKWQNFLLICALLHLKRQSKMNALSQNCAAHTLYCWHRGQSGIIQRAGCLWMYNARLFRPFPYLVIWPHLPRYSIILVM